MTSGLQRCPSRFHQLLFNAALALTPLARLDLRLRSSARIQTVQDGFGCLPPPSRLIDVACDCGEDAFGLGSTRERRVLPLRRECLLEERSMYRWSRRVPGGMNDRRCGACLSRTREQSKGLGGDVMRVEALNEYAPTNRNELSQANNEDV